jgi:peptide/nickel transport system substrate-binding protein
MKKSFLIQFAIMILLIIFANLGLRSTENYDDDELGNAGGIRIDLTGTETVFESSPKGLTPQKGGTLVLAESAEPEHLNTYTSTSAAATRVLDYIYETLLDYDYETWRFDRPVLAESFAISEDGYTFTFKIRQNVYWHDGQQLTADDVLFSIKAVLNPFVDSAPMRSSFSKVVSAHTNGPYEFVISSSETYFRNQEILGGFHIIPKHIWDPRGLLDRYSVEDLLNTSVTREEAAIKEFADDFNSHPQGRPVGAEAKPIIGSGPWVFDKWITGNYISFARNDNYWNSDSTYIKGYSEEGAYLDKVIVKVITDATARLTALKAGEIDFIPRMRAVQYFTQTNTPDFLEKFQKVSYVVPAYSYIGWNNDKPYFSDKRVRQAMTMLIDRDSYNKYVAYGLGIPTVGPFYIYGEQYNHDIERWPYDPIRAVELIEEAGWIDHDGDGIRDKDGVPFNFTFSVSAGSTSSKYMALMLKEDLRKVGIIVNIRQLEWSVYVENLRDRQFDVVSLLWIGGLESDPYQIWHSDNIGDRGSNYIGFRNAEADSLIETARFEMDKEKRNAMYFRLQEIFHEEQPYTFMFYQRDPGAYLKEFNGVKWIPIRPGYKLYSWWRNTSVLGESS